MQAITSELEALLKSHFQLGANGFRGRVTIGGSGGGGSGSGSCYGLMDSGGESEVRARLSLDSTGAESVRWQLLVRGAAADGALYLIGNADTPTSGTTEHAVIWFLSSTSATVGYRVSAAENLGSIDTTSIDPTEPFYVAFQVDADGTLHAKIWQQGDSEPGWDVEGATDAQTLDTLTVYWFGSDALLFVEELRVWVDDVEVGDPFDDFGREESLSNWGDSAHGESWSVSAGSGASAVIVCSAPSTTWPIISATVEKSLSLACDQANIVLVTEGLPTGWGRDRLFATNVRVVLEQWFGDDGGDANAVVSFTGVLDEAVDTRDPLRLSLACRDMFAILKDGNFGATAPQDSAEVGADETEDNGVYLNREVSYIVADILDRAGWPAADRDILETSYVLARFVLTDGWSWAEAIVGSDRLAGLVVYSAWADELGVFHFRPTVQAGSFTDPVVPVWSYRSGEDLVSLRDASDQFSLRTRVKARGPLTTTTLTDTWRELWRTTKLSRPVGLWFDPSAPSIIRVIDRGTKELYRIQQSDRAVLGHSPLTPAIPHPLGLSGDPADATVFWVLNAPWIDGLAATGNSAKKVRKADNVVLATYALPNGRLSDLKVSAAYIWITNLDTDRFYSRSKTDGTAVADYSHTYGAVVQANPSGIMVDGTTLYVFWSNAGTTARFLVADESAPGTVDHVVSTPGTALIGGEMDTLTHTECYGSSDVLGLVAKFTLLLAVDQTDVVAAEAVDIALEDELGMLAQLEPRVHDAHPGDAAHAFMIRRDTVDLSKVLSQTQIETTAALRLAILAKRRRVIDSGVVGNPALQKTDVVEIVDDLTGLSELVMIDTYRTQMDAEGTYLGTFAGIPLDVADDAPVDDGGAT